MIAEPGRQLRRKVQTGEWVRRSYSRGKVEAVQKHFGRRIVCKGCARDMDRKALWKEVRDHALVLLLLGGLVLALFIMSST